MGRDRHRSAWPALVALVLIGLTAGIASAAEPVTRDAKVTYLTSATVYVDAGSEEGVQEGDVLDVVRNGTVVGWLHVFVVSTHKSGCRREDPGLDIVVGDIVRFVPHVDPTKACGELLPPRATSATGAAAAEAPRRASSGRGMLRDWGLAGRIGLRYLLVQQPDTGYQFNQPGVDVRIAGTNLGGSPMGLEVDIRTYRSYRVSGDQSAQLQTNRVYRANASWTGRDVPVRVVAGRMYSPTLATVSLFDGVLAEYAGPRWSIGGLAGSQPNPVTYGFSSDVRQYGGYATLRGLPGRKSNWGATMGLVGSYQEGEINREFLYLQGYYDTPRFSAYLAQEIDFNRGWKREQESSAISPTSIFGTVRFRVTQQFTLSAGIDSRRNVLLYRDYIDPLIEFDDAFREGYWAARRGVVPLADGGRERALRPRRRRRGRRVVLAAPRVVAAPDRVARRRRPRDLLQQRASEGAAVLAGAGSVDHADHPRSARRRHAPGDRTALDVPETQLLWYGLNFDIAFGRHWLYLLSFEQTTGGIEDNRQLFTSFSYRF